jgi:hypothetical protein
MREEIDTEKPTKEGAMKIIKVYSYCPVCWKKLEIKSYGLWCSKCKVHVFYELDTQTNRGNDGLKS